MTTVELELFIPWWFVNRDHLPSIVPGRSSFHALQRFYQLAQGGV